MPKKTLVIQGCWAIAVLAAFGLGSLRRAPALDAEASQAVPSKGSRAAGGIGGDDRALGRGVGSATSVEAGRNRERSGDSSMNADDWETLARQAVRDSNPLTRRLAFSRLLAALTPENALAIREQLVAFGADGAEWRDFNYAWGALGGREVIDFAATSKEPDLDAALTGWASANPGEALAFLDNLPEELRGDRDRFAASVVAGLADRDPALATDLVLRLAGEGNGTAEKLIEIVANTALRSGTIEDAAAWSEALPDGALKGAAMDRIANDYAERDPEAAAQWAQRFADQDYAARVIEEVGDEWAERNPVAAATWLESLPEGAGQVAGLRSVFGDWEDRDPTAAGEYLLNMPRSAQRDSAISGFSQGYAWQDPQVAIAWAQDIGDADLRVQTLTRAGQAFFRRDPDSARAWLETSGLPAEAQQAVLEPRRRQ